MRNAAEESWSRNGSAVCSKRALRCSSVSSAMGRDAMTREMRGSAATPPEMRGSAATPRRTITDGGADRAVGWTVVDVTQVATPLFDLRFPGGGALPGGGGLPRDDLRARGVRHSPHARTTGRTAGSLRADRLRDGGAART